LTADTTTETRHRALAAGAKDFLTKPFDSIELSLRIQTLAEARFLHVRLREENRTLEARVQERTQLLAQAEIEAVECLALAAEYRDDDTGQHAQRVGHMTALLAARLGIDPGQAASLRRAAPLHDVGKIGIPDRILLKPGKLTPDEFAAMQQHTIIGAKILSRHHTRTMQIAATVALSHHERWDGSGYPHRLAGTEIPLAGRLVGIADVFDALTHERPYKRAWSVCEALAEITRGAGRQFDPDAASAFTDLIASQPERVMPDRYTGDREIEVR
jgi:putative two-component system response regulator